MVMVMVMVMVMGTGQGFGCWDVLTILVHGHQVTAGFEMHAQLKEDELT